MDSDTILRLDWIKSIKFIGIPEINGNPVTITLNTNQIIFPFRLLLFLLQGIQERLLSL
jgi:hypothetical protein